MSDQPIDPLKPLDAQLLFDISGMSTQDANEYVLSIVAHLKQTQAELTTLDKDLELWKSRAVLAQQQNRGDLAQSAQEKIAQLESKKSELGIEEQQFREGVESLKKQLRLLPSTQRTINPEALLQSLEQIAGPLDQTTPELKKIQAEDALAELKRKLAEGK